MKVQIKTPLQSLSGFYIKSVIDEHDFQLFKTKIKKLSDDIKISNDKSQTEKHLEKLLNNFLNDVFYQNRKYINSKSYKGLNECDLVIHNGKDIESFVGVMFELKTPRNLNEMITKDNFLKQSFYETILYYLWEKVVHKNNEIHNIIITNFKDWFVIDSKEFQKLFTNPKLVKFFESWRSGSTDSDKTKQMYQFIESFIKERNLEITSTHFDLDEYIELLEKSDKKSIEKIVSIYKLLSPRHLLSEKNDVDSNSLNKNFYNELLYIIGVEEVTEVGKILIKRKEKRQSGSLIENTIHKLKSEGLLENLENRLSYGDEYKDQLFNVSLELCITWINRVIFLKLLETQLINYHRGNKDYSFIGSEKIESFQNLNQLFFEVLSERVSKRDVSLKKKFKNIVDINNIPYLNSSLFEPTQLEKKTLRISGLDDEMEIVVDSKSNLKENEKSLKGTKLNTIKYLLKFLESYDFGLTKDDKVIRSSSEKTIINSSVLGLIFEKINGYKDGSVFTPSFITTEMCRETLEKIVVKRFNEKFNWDCLTYIDLYNKIDVREIDKYNDVINSIRICDPSVGSGHYLVSMLNEIIRVKSHLGILKDREGKRIRDIDISIENDELICRLTEGELFDYTMNEIGGIIPFKQTIQETLFSEKKTIIENCLFGVDINPNSVQICRLRLWIELLKSSFYTKDSNYKELQTLPNIDINIKQGNTLIQKFNIDENLSTLFKGKFMVKDYQENVKKYKETNDKKDKEGLIQYLRELKKEFKTSVPSKLQVEVNNSTYDYNQYKLKLENLKVFGEKVSIKEKEKLRELEEEVKIKQNKIEEIKTNVHYNESFEWRFEFPEVLNDKGEFMGFDIIIGNPPYVVVKKDNYLTKFYNWNTDLYLMFFELSLNKLLKIGGYLSFITPRFYLVNQNCLNIRKHFVDNTHTYKLIETNPFEEVNTECVITYIEKTSPTLEFIPIYQEKNKEFLKINELEKELIRKRNQYTIITFLTREIDEVLDEIEKETNPISEITIESVRGMEIGKKDLINEKGFHSLIGEDLNRYVIEYQNTHVSSTHKEYIRLKKFFERDNMVYLRRVSKDLKSTISEIKYSFNKNIYGISLSKDYSNYFVCGLLNSELLNYYYKYKFSSKKEDIFPEVQKYLYEQLPIKVTSSSEQKPIINIVKKLLKNPTDQTLIEELNNEVYSLYNINTKHKSVIRDLLLNEN